MTTLLVEETGHGERQSRGRLLMRYRNAAHAFISELAEIRSHGSHVSARGMPTRELLARSVTLEHPMERFITVPGRRNDVFATIAETMWVIAGRDDMAYLGRYLTRAIQYSDDQLTWRGGYGPRLRDWEGVDQVDEIRKLLTLEPESRRAVAVLFDPARDFVETLDVPCNNWLHFLVRDGQLHLNVAVRSNDVIWGFSGINTFEWSVLHEMMAFWLGAQVGQGSYFISSLHLYDERIPQADRALTGFLDTTEYEQGWVGAPFETRWEDFPGVLDKWFEVETAMSSGTDCRDEIARFPDPLLRQFLQALAIKWEIARGADEACQRELVGELGHSDIAFALREQLFRDSADLLAAATGADWTELRELIMALHRSKDAAYRNSWKRRGELISIAANLARKVDRIDQIVSGASAGSESLLDTAVDLLVYAVKYQTYLADQSTEVARAIFARSGGHFSDGPEGFEERFRAIGFVDDEFVDVVHEAAAASSAFDDLDALLQLHPQDHWVEKLVLAETLTLAAIRLTQAVAESDPRSVAVLRQHLGRG